MGGQAFPNTAWLAVARPGLAFALEHQKEAVCTAVLTVFVFFFLTNSFQPLMHAEQCLEPLTNIISFNSHNPSTRKLLLSCFYI